MAARAQAFAAEMALRRTVRHFAPDPVPREVIASALQTAGSAPSGAHMQPWHFVVVQDTGHRRAIREAAEREEHEFYHSRATAEWLEALAPLGTDEHKPYLEIAPVLIAIFVRRYALRADGTRMQHYYATESVGIATGFLIAALHLAGLATLTHTPSPMGFLNHVLQRPVEERPFLLLVAGFPAPGAQVPAIRRKSLEDTSTWL
jgi:nitroreductase